MQETTFQDTTIEEKELGTPPNREQTSDSLEDIDIGQKETGGPGGQEPPLDPG